MKVSTLIIVSIPIVLGLQIKDTVGTTTENTFWYQLFGTPSRSQPAAVAATAAGTEVQGFTPISTSSSSSSSSAAPWYQGLFGVGRTTLGQVTTPSRTSTTTTTSNPIAPTTSIANSNNLFGTDTAPTTTTTTNARSRSRSTPVTVSGDNVLTLFGNPNLSTGNDQSNSVSKTTAETTTTSLAPSSSSSSSSRLQPTVINGGGSDGVLTLFGNSEALSNFDSTTVVDSDSTARITPIASASASSGSSTKDNDSDSSSARGIKSIPNSSEFLASLINGLGSGGGGNGSGSNTNSYKNHSTTSTTSKYFNSSSTATKLSSSKSIYSNSTTSRSSLSVSSSSTDGGGGANLFGLLLNSVAAVSRTLAAESTLSTGTTTTSDSANSNTKDYSSYSGTITSFPSTTGSLSGDGNKLIGGNKYLISFMWTNLILTMIMLFT